MKNIKYKICLPLLMNIFKPFKVKHHISSDNAPLSTPHRHMHTCKYAHTQRDIYIYKYTYV